MLLTGRARRSMRAILAVLSLAGMLRSTPRAASSVPSPEPDPLPEVRALWVLRTSLASPASITALVQSARDHGFNTLLVQVRGRGDAYYNDAVEPRAAELQRQPATFDPLATVLGAAHTAGLRVHAWVNVNLVASAVELPLAREHLVYRHPEWLMVPRDIAQDIARLPADSPAYVGKIARWTRGQPGELEGLYASPIIPGAATYLETVVRGIANRYPIDGIHFDYARYPNPRFDYSRLAIAEFRAAIRPRLDDGVRRQVDAREKVDLFAYPDARPDDWRAFRMSRMTALMRRLGAAVKAERPGALVTVATKPDLREAYADRLQDWGAWLRDGIVDVACPMAYTPEAARFADQITAATAAANGRPIWAGIGAYRLTPAQTVDNIQAARRIGAAGVILFSYDSLTDPKLAAPGYLEKVARAAFPPAAPAPASR